MRRIVRGLLWVVKGVLLAVALGALVFWPMSYRYEGCVRAWRSALRPDGVAWHQFAAAWRNGRICLDETRETLIGEGYDLLRELVELQGSDWSGRVVWGTPSMYPDDFADQWGPFKWNPASWVNNDEPNGKRQFSISCWFLALSTGAWPLFSFTLLLRRRARRRRLARVGCCRKCGYDLRATPQPGGELVTRCPECGTATGRAAGDMTPTQL